MSDIAKLYEQVMAEQPAATGEPEFDGEFFAKVASGDDEALQALNEVIDEARASGATDDQIEAALTEAAEASGYDDNDDGDFETAKVSAYGEGAAQAAIDMLNSDLAKTAGITADDLMEYELGLHYGAGYAQTRQEIEDAMSKIAAKKVPKPGALGKVRDTIAEMIESRGKGKHSRALVKKYVKKDPGLRTDPNALEEKVRKHYQRLATGAMVGTGAGVAGVGGGLGYATGRAQK